MFKNYLKIAFRNLWKNKGFSAINIFGLASALAICLLILIDITWWILAIAALLAVLIALATIFYQAIKAAVANPVDSLRSE